MDGSRCRQSVELARRVAPSTIHLFGNLTAGRVAVPWVRDAVAAGEAGFIRPARRSGRRHQCSRSIETYGSL